jgi:pyruvate/2-oxoglutarate dehydrogenase complex dihydrolipoamide dehydrogenase (E3) component
MPKFDAIIIGTGQAGPSLARRLVAAAQNVAIIERKLFGGTCVNTGCTPTKTLVASAYAAHLARRGAEFGVVINGGVSIDMKQVKARKNAVVAVSNKGVEHSLKTLKGCTVYEGHARFVSPRAVSVGNDVLEAERIFINVGGRPLVPDILGLDQVKYLDNSSIMDCRPAASGDHRRQLHWAGIRTDLPTVRQPGDRNRDGAPAHCARGRRRIGSRRRHSPKRGNRRSPGRAVHHRRKA